MLQQSTMHPVVWINKHTYISIVKNADYNLEVWEITAENRQHRMARMNYKYHRDNFAGFIYRLFPQIDLIQIHNIQKKINPYFDLEV
ncbi:hypothetical protein FEI15_07210 [Lacticaseibacillus zeae]|uniref:Uncharacterized protein n=1 Tax=Lacticaseibacillus zeae TaxID=57037 RepID=A0A5R8LRD3_LACZE|nr:hypothetical protein [Lacticaseibacillus zeae]TLF39728.1 hypothetical protein FEI15_07210 [Lacticaseibacillus zeae]